MVTRRALFYGQHIGGHQYMLRIRDNFPTDRKQWFAFDSRTNSIRAFYKRSFALANRRGYGFRINNYVVMRKFRGDNTDRIRWYNGSRRNLQNNGRKCLDVHGNRNVDNRHVIFYNCHNGLNQGWTLDQKGETYSKQPLPDRRRFQIRTKLSGGRAVEVREHIGGHQYRLRIKTYFPANDKQWFTFDRRSRTIRSWWRKNYAISNQRG